MQQGQLFADRERIEHQGLSLKLIRDFIPAAKSHQLLQQLIDNSAWEQPQVRVYGKWHLTPRLVCFHGDSPLSYAYSQLRHGPQAWTPLLSSLRDRVSNISGAHFNAVLLNYYRDGRDSIGWHADDEPELGVQPTIASLSLGAARDLHFKPKTGAGERISLNLPGGSLLIMRGDTQQHWQHHLPRRARCSSPRVNLTFRWIQPTPAE